MFHHDHLNKLHEMIVNHLGRKRCLLYKLESPIFPYEVLYVRQSQYQVQFLGSASNLSESHE